VCISDCESLVSDDVDDDYDNGGMVCACMCVCMCVALCQTPKDHSVSNDDDANEKTRLRPSVSDIIKAHMSGLLLG